MKSSFPSIFLFRTVTAAVFVAAGWPSSAVSAVGDATTWVFNAPAIANAAQNPPYDPVASLQLTETAGGVQFVLDPNELNSGYGANSFINQLFFVYNASTGPALTGGNIDKTESPPQTVDTFTWNAGNPIDQFSLPNGHTEAGYSSLIIQVGFPSKNSDGELRFRPTETSTWTVLGTHLTDFTATSATANSKPSPMFGLLSLNGFNDDSSN